MHLKIKNFCFGKTDWENCLYIGILILYPTKLRTFTFIFNLYHIMEFSKIISKQLTCKRFNICKIQVHIQYG